MEQKQLNPDKAVIRLYSFSKTYGRTTLEVFLQDDGQGDFDLFETNGGRGRVRVPVAINHECKYNWLKDYIKRKQDN